MPITSGSLCTLLHNVFLPFMLTNAASEDVLLSRKCHCLSDILSCTKFNKSSVHCLSAIAKCSLSLPLALISPNCVPIIPDQLPAICLLLMPPTFSFVRVLFWLMLRADLSSTTTKWAIELSNWTWNSYLLILGLLCQTVLLRSLPALLPLMVLHLVHLAVHFAR